MTVPTEMGISTGGQRPGHEGACYPPPPIAWEKTQTLAGACGTHPSWLLWQVRSHFSLLSAPAVLRFCLQTRWALSSSFYLELPPPALHLQPITLGKVGLACRSRSLSAPSSCPSIVHTWQFHKTCLWACFLSLPGANQLQHSSVIVSTASRMPRAQHFAGAG